MVYGFLTTFETVLQLWLASWFFQKSHKKMSPGSFFGFFLQHFGEVAHTNKMGHFDAKDFSNDHPATYPSSWGLWWVVKLKISFSRLKLAENRASKVDRRNIEGSRKSRNAHRFRCSKTPSKVRTCSSTSSATSPNFFCSGTPYLGCVIGLFAFSYDLSMLCAPWWRFRCRMLLFTSFSCKILFL